MDMRIILPSLFALLLTACGGGEVVVEEPPQQRMVLAWTGGKTEGEFCTAIAMCGAGSESFPVTAKIVGGVCTIPTSEVSCTIRGH